jgi:CRISPR-associated protein Cmr3
MLKFTIEPYDVLFFGSGKPFNIGSNVESIFPPFPHSFAAAVYAKFVSETGITIRNGKGIYKAVYGPFIEKSGIVYFPAPSDILKEKKKEESSKFKIADRCNQFSLINIEDTDLGSKIDSLLWSKPDGNDSSDYEPFRGFISITGLKKWFNNEEIRREYLLSYNDIFEQDERVSIHIDHEKGTVQEEDGLYRVNFVQLKKDVKFVFWIEADYSENSLLREKNILDDDNFKKIFDTKPMVLKLGGETKAARYCIDNHDFNDLFNGFNQSNNDFRKILFLTCGIFDNKNEKNNKTIIDNLDKFLTGVIDGYTIVGINSKYNNKYGLKTVRAIKPGSVVYLKNEAISNDNEVITFFNQNDSFIGSNLVLIK